MCACVCVCVCTFDSVVRWGADSRLEPRVSVGYEQMDVRKIYPANVESLFVWETRRKGNYC
jgi:hypothetical protein